MSALNASELEKQWQTEARWNGVQRPYNGNDVLKLRGSIHVEHTLARLGAERLWSLLHRESYVAALGALTGNQAVQQVQAGLKAIYLSGWQVAADANGAGQMYPDQSLYPADSVPNVVRKINNSLMRADQVHHMDGKNSTYWFAPIVADAEAGFGGTLNAFELMKAMIEAGAACVHFEDQLSSAKKCGHLGGKVLVPTSEAIQKLVAARLAADVMGVPTLIMARTDADSAHLLTSDIDPRDHAFVTGERTSEGFFRIRGGLDSAIARGLAYAPFADLIWCETSEPNLEEARRFADAIHAQYPGQIAGLQLLAFLQLEEEARSGHHRQLPARVGEDGIQVPVRDAGRLPRAQPEHVRVGARLQGCRDDRLLASAGKGICTRSGVRLPGREAPALRGYGILRRAHASDRWWTLFYDSPGRLNRAGTVH